MISILQPLYLLAFLGLIVPVAIHLWNKKEGNVLKIGTIRWMKKNVSSRVSRMKFHDLLLFLLRCAIISLVVFILAEVIIKRCLEKEVLKWALIDAHVDFNKDQIRQLRDTLKSNGFEVRALDYGFKNIGVHNDLSKKEALYNTWSVLKTAELLEDQPDSILVVTKGYIKNFSGTKPEFSIPLGWMIIPDQDPTLFIHEARFLNDDSLIVKIGKSGSNYTQVAEYVVDLQNPVLSGLKEIGPSVSFQVRGDSLELQKDTKRLTVKAINSTDSLRVLIFYGESSEKDLVYWKAGLHALSKHQNIPLLLEATNSDKSEDVFRSGQVLDWLIVLENDGVHNAELLAKKVFLSTVSHDSLDRNWFALKEKNDRQIHNINNSMANDKAFLQSFPAALLEVFQRDFDSSLWLNDKRTIPFEQLDLSKPHDINEDESDQKVSHQRADSFFWIATLSLLIFERLVSFKREHS